MGRVEADEVSGGPAQRLGLPAPAMVCAFQGWNDAGDAKYRASAKSDPEPLRFDQTVGWTPI